MLGQLTYEGVEPGAQRGPSEGGQQRHAGNDLGEALNSVGAAGFRAGFRVYTE